ncbi:C5orf22 [Cordylochernes scorpioides]|uniref:C5orf22 n=1 Tax=Cordylochernes scorpioides TaxID=51811 RepID=A0ABY6LIT6_9ARAC|nr:C5orf22 [Cordylochernes scorpioides]
MGGEQSSSKRPPTIFVVNDHNDLLEILFHDLRNKRLPWNISLLSLDSHPDLQVPLSMQLSPDYFGLYKIKDYYEVGGWILPAAAAGHISSITIAKPPWSYQIKSGNYSFKVGKHKATECVRVSCKEPYFIASQLYSPEDSLENAKEVSLDIHEITNSPPPKIESPYILNIDLDFFSTRNPALLDLHPRVFKLIHELYGFKRVPGESAEQQVESRRCQIENIQALIDQVEKTGSLSDLPPSPQKQILQDILDISPDPYWRWLNVAGLTYDLVSAPHHPSSAEEVDELLEAATHLLSVQDYSPQLVTLSRLTQTSCCPPDMADPIQDKVLDMLNAIFGPDLEVVEAYMLQNLRDKILPLYHRSEIFASEFLIKQRSLSKERRFLNGSTNLKKYDLSQGAVDQTVHTAENVENIERDFRSDEHIIWTMPGNNSLRFWSKKNRKQVCASCVNLRAKGDTLVKACSIWLKTIEIGKIK